MDDLLSSIPCKKIDIDNIICIIMILLNMRGDQKVRGKVLLYHIGFIDCNDNSHIETTIHCKLTEIEI